MADIYFRTTLSGYNKQDVMKFIEKLNCEQNERVGELNEQIRLLHIELKRTNDELSAIRARSEELDEKLAASTALSEANAEKAEKYDDMQETFADLMLNAEREAQKKIAAAEAEAERIVEAAREQIEAKKRELDEMKSEFSDTFVENKQIIERSKEEFSGVFEKICTSIETIYSKVTNACKKADNSDK
jgi:erythromycin esterase-like protein